MSGGRTAAVVVLGIVLTVTVGAGNAVFAAQSTVLSQDFVTTAVEEEGGYEVLTDEMRRAIRNATEGAVEGGIGGGAFGSIVDGNPIADAVTPIYAESQVEPNVRALYDYLHGRSDRLNLSVRTQPLAEQAGENVAASVRNATVSELVAATPGDPFADLPVDAAFLDRLDEGPDAYAAAKADLREEIRSAVVAELVDRAFAERSNDDLLRLVVPDYDPDEYTAAEKERMVADRESEIRTALERLVEQERGEEIDDAVDDRLEQFRQQALAEGPTAEQVGNASVARAAGDLQAAVVTGVTTDQSYEAYRDEVTSARADLGTAVGNYVTGQITAEAGVVDLNEQLGIPERGEFDGARTVVGYLDLSMLVLPVLALALLGGVYFLSRSVATTAATLGASLVVGTVPALVGAPMAGDRLRAAIDLEGEAAASLEPVIDGIVGQVVGAVSGQSLALLVVGLCCLAGAAAVRYDLDDRVRARWQGNETGTTDDSGATGTTDDSGATGTTGDSRRR